jgi:hypothetical protein
MVGGVATAQDKGKALANVMGQIEKQHGKGCGHAAR